MVTKDNLIGFLEKTLANEEEFINRYGSSLLADLDKLTELSDEEKNNIQGSFIIMLEDTKGHRQTISELIQKIKGEGRNEY